MYLFCLMLLHVEQLYIQYCTILFSQGSMNLLLYFNASITLRENRRLSTEMKIEKKKSFQFFYLISSFLYAGHYISVYCYYTSSNYIFNTVQYFSAKVLWISFFISMHQLHLGKTGDSQQTNEDTKRKEKKTFQLF